MPSTLRRYFDRSHQWTRIGGAPLRRSVAATSRVVRVADFIYRIVAITLVVAGWLGECALVLFRNVFDVEPAWSVDLVTLGLMYGSILFVAATASHIGFTLVINRVSGKYPWARAVPRLITAAIAVGFLIVSTDAVRQSAALGATTGNELNYPQWLVFLVAPIMSGVLALRLIFRKLEH